MILKYDVLPGAPQVPPGPADPDARGPFFSGASGVRSAPRNYNY